MEKEGYLSRAQVLEEVAELEFTAREELVRLEKAYDDLKLRLDALDECCIKLDGQIEMIMMAKSRLRTLDIHQEPGEE